MDEVWQLALSTGRGSPFDAFPRDTLVRNVPAWTAVQGSQPWWKIWTNLGHVTHPPLYFIALHGWRSLFGDSDSVAIALSMAWSCVTLVFIYLGVRLALGRSAAFWSAAAFAVAPTSSYFAMEVRSYSMLTAEAAIAIWLLVRLTLHGPRNRDVIGLCVTLLACMLTHYFGVFACMIAGCYALAVSGRHWLRVLSFGLITAGLYAAIWLPRALEQYHFVTAGIEFLEAAQRRPWWSLALALTLPFRLLAEAWTWPPLGISACGCFVMLLGVGWVAVRRPSVRPFADWYAAVAGYLLLTDVLRQTQQLEFIRYGAAAQPAVVIFVQLIAVGLVGRQWLCHVAGLALCAVAFIAQPNAMRHDAPVFTSAALALAPRMATGDALLVYADPAVKHTVFAPEALVLEFSHVPGCFPRDAVLVEHPPTADLDRALRGRQAWLVTVTDEVDVSRLLPGAKVIGQAEYWLAMDASGPQIAYRVSFPDVPATTASGLP
ncbi:MAG: hypothetical protein JWM57_2803 [Phycisphaerales bacterium]|nr:hypothetical protein [Phycisphaerales bacterium]